MQRSSRMLTALACAAVGLAILVWILIRSTSGPTARPATSELSETSNPGERTPLSSDLDAQRPRAGAERRQDFASVPTARPGVLVPAKLCVRGRVLDDATGTPLPRFTVLHSPAGVGAARVDSMLGFEYPEPAHGETFAGTDGSFELDDVDSTPQSVAAFAAGHERSDPVSIAPGSEGAGGEEIEIRLRRAALVRGRVVDPATGVPVQGALVGWIDRQGKARTGPRERFERTDALGRFALECVPCSARRILAGREDLGEGLSDRLVLAPGEPAPEIVIELRRSGS